MSRLLSRTFCGWSGSDSILAVVRLLSFGQSEYLTHNKNRSTASQDNARILKKQNKTKRKENKTRPSRVHCGAEVALITQDVVNRK